MKTGKNQTIIKRITALLLAVGMMLSPVADTMLTVRAERGSWLEGIGGGRQKGTPSDATKAETDADRQDKPERGSGKGGRKKGTPSEASRGRRPKGTPSEAAQGVENATPSVALPAIQSLAGEEIVSCFVTASREDGTEIEDGEGVLPGEKITYKVTVKNNDSLNGKLITLKFPYSDDKVDVKFESGNGWQDFWTYYEYSTWPDKLLPDEEVEVYYTVQVKANATGVVAREFELVVEGGSPQPQVFPEFPIQNVIWTYTTDIDPVLGVVPGDIITYTLTVKTVDGRFITLWCPSSDETTEIVGGDYPSSALYKIQEKDCYQWFWTDIPSGGGTKTATYQVKVKEDATGEVAREFIWRENYDDANLHKETLPAIPIVKKGISGTVTADRKGVVQGNTVTYTVTMRNTDTKAHALQLWCGDALGDVVAVHTEQHSDDGVKNGTNMIWNLLLDPGTYKTITYTMKVKDDVAGDTISKVYYYAENENGAYDAPVDLSPLPVPILSIHVTPPSNLWQTNHVADFWVTQITNTSSTTDAVVSYGRIFNTQDGVIINPSTAGYYTDGNWQMYDQPKGNLKADYWLNPGIAGVYDELYQYWYNFAGNLLLGAQTLMTEYGGSMYLRRAEVTIPKQNYELWYTCSAFVDYDAMPKDSIVWDTFCIDDEVVKRSDFSRFSLTSSVSPETVIKDGGEDVIYTITIDNNTGAVIADSWELVIPVPEGISVKDGDWELFISEKPNDSPALGLLDCKVDDTDPANPKFLAKLSNMYPGQMKITLKTKLNDDPPLTIEFKNVTLGGISSPEQNADVIDAFTLESSINPLTATKADGGTITYSMTIKNNTGKDLPGPWDLVIPVPDGISVKEGDWNLSSNGNAQMSPPVYSDDSGSGGSGKKITAKVSNIDSAFDAVITFTAKLDSDPLPIIYFKDITLGRTLSPEQTVKITDISLLKIDFDSSNDPSYSSPPGASFKPGSKADNNDTVPTLRFVVENISGVELNGVKVTIPLDNRIELVPNGGFLGLEDYLSYKENGVEKTIPYRSYDSDVDTYSKMMTSDPVRFSQCTDWECVYKIGTIQPGKKVMVPEEGYFVVNIREAVLGSFVVQPKAEVEGFTQSAMPTSRTYVITPPKLVTIEADKSDATLDEKITYTITALKEAENTVKAFNISLKIPSGTVIQKNKEFYPKVWKCKEGDETPVLLEKDTDYTLVDNEKPNLILKFLDMEVEADEWIEVKYSVTVDVLGGIIRNYAIVQLLEQNNITNEYRVTGASFTEPQAETEISMPETEVTVNQILKDKDGNPLDKYLKSDEVGIGNTAASNINFTVTITNKSGVTYTGNVNAGGQIIFVGLEPGMYTVTEVGTSETSFLLADNDADFIIRNQNDQVSIDLVSRFTPLPGFSSASGKTNYMSLPNIDFTRMLRYQLGWLANMQLTETSGAGQGAIPLTDSFGGISDSVSEDAIDKTSQYPYSIRPYFALEAANAFLLDEDYFDNATRYIEWHLTHINGDPDMGLRLLEDDGMYEEGTIYDYSYDFLGQEVVTKTLAPDTDGVSWFDSIDSYAARLFELLYRYYKAPELYKTGGAEKKQTAINLINQYSDVIEKIYKEALVDCLDNGNREILYDDEGKAIFDEEGFPTGDIIDENALLSRTNKKHYSTRYLMDNLEVYRGFLMAVELGKSAYIDPDLKAVLSSASDYAVKVKDGIEKRLWNGETGLYDWACWNPSDLDDGPFYPDASAQLFPIIFGLDKPDDNDEVQNRAELIYEKFCEAYPEWTSHEVDAFPWTQMTYAAAIMGNLNGCIDSLRYIQKNYQFEANPYPMTNQEAGTTIVTIATFMQKYYDKMNRIYPLLAQYRDGEGVKEYEYAKLGNLLEE